MTISWSGAHIASCPQCQGDLVDAAFDLWCPACQQSFSYAQVASNDGDRPDD